MPITRSLSRPIHSRLFRALTDAGVGGWLSELPNASMFWWTTNPTSIDDTVYVSTCRDSNDVWLDVYRQPSSGGAYYQRSYFLGYVGNNTAQDDHHAGAVCVRAGQPLVVIYSGHAYDNVIYYRTTLKNIDAYSPSEALTFGEIKKVELPAINTTGYVEVLLRDGDDNIRFLHRTGSVANRWSLTTLPAWGAGTPSTVEVFSSADQFYVMGRVVGDSIRCAIADHPDLGTDNKVWYAEIDLVSGAVTKSDGTVIGNLDGTSLPIAEASCELIFTATGTEKPWIFDIGYGANREVAFVTGALHPNFAATGDYMYAVKAGASWTVSPVTQVGSFLGGAYFPSIVFDPAAAGAVFLARESAGTTYVERHSTANSGATWASSAISSAVVATDTTLTRVFAVKSADAVAPIFTTLATEIDTYPTYNGAWVSRVRPMPRSAEVRRHADIDESVPDILPAASRYLSGVSGDYVSIPNAGLGDLANGIRLEADVALDSWASGAIQNLLAKESSGTNRSVRLIVNADGKIGIYHSLNGTTTALLQSNTIPPFSPGERVEVATTFIPVFNGTQYRLRIHYRKPGQAQWTELATIQNTATVGPIFSTNSPWEIGSRWGGTTELAKGSFYRASVMTPGRTPVVAWLAP